jgi:hypothetical protein
VPTSEPVHKSDERYKKASMIWRVRPMRVRVRVRVRVRGIEQQK